MNNIILQVKYNKAIVYREGEHHSKFVCVTISNKSMSVAMYNVGDVINSWENGHCFTNLTDCVLYFNDIIYNIETVVVVMDNIDLEKDFDIFECTRCGETFEIYQRCKDHGGENICKDCCDVCAAEMAYWNSINSKIDMMRDEG